MSKFDYTEVPCESDLPKYAEELIIDKLNTELYSVLDRMPNETEFRFKWDGDDIICPSIPAFVIQQVFENLLDFLIGIDVKFVLQYGDSDNTVQLMSLDVDDYSELDRAKYIAKFMGFIHSHLDERSNILFAIGRYNTIDGDLTEEQKIFYAEFQKSLRYYNVTKAPETDLKDSYADMPVLVYDHFLKTLEPNEF